MEWPGKNLVSTRRHAAVLSAGLQCSLAAQKLWADAPTGYHLVNILVHAASALLLVKVLRRLEVPGAWLGAALWALHPVQVESVAWMSELKNTLSGLCYLGSALAYCDLTGRGRGSVLPGFAGIVWGGVAGQVGHCDLAGGAAAGVLVEAEKVAVEGGCAAAGAVFYRGHGTGFVHGVDGANDGHGHRPGSAPFQRGPVFCARPGDLVLSGQAGVAASADIYLSALGGERGGLVAIPVSGGAAAAGGGVMLWAAEIANWAAGGFAFFCRDAISGAGIF